MNYKSQIKKSLVLSMKISLITILLMPVLSLIPRWITHQYALNKVFTAEDSPSTRVAIIFGAGLRRDGSPTAVLRDRVATGVDLYQSGKVEKLLMSGDNSYLNYNEPGAMAEYAHQLGVPNEDIVMDFAGRRTYDTCYRAKYIFKVDHAVLVTQGFHLPRAIFTCGQLGIDSFGVLANRRTYSRAAYSYWHFREIPATVRAIWDLWIQKPVPLLGSPEPIFSSPENSLSTNKN